MTVSASGSVDISGEVIINEIGSLTLDGTGIGSGNVDVDGVFQVTSPSGAMQMSGRVAVSKNGLVAVDGELQLDGPVSCMGE